MEDRRQKPRGDYRAFVDTVEVCVLKSWQNIIKKNERIGKKFSSIFKDDKEDGKR